MKKSICYLRVSTEEQSHESQRHAIDRYLQAHGLTPEFYEEKGSGGTTLNRPIYTRLMQEVREGKIDKIYVYKLDRFSRNVRDFLTAHEEMVKAGTSFVSISDNLDFSTPMGRMMAQMLAVFAEFEREQIKARVKASCAARKAKGVRLGHEPMPIDWQKFQILKQSGMNIRQIAKVLAISKSALYERLSKAV